MDKIRVLLADDQVLFSESLKYTIESKCDDIKIVGIAKSGLEAVELTDSLKPDISLLDIRMPVMTGVEAADVIHKKNPNIIIVMLTAFEDDEYVRDAIKNGAIGYILKNRPALELINVIRTVKNGIIQLDPNVARQLLYKNLENASLPSSELMARHHLLTDREKDILKLMVQSKDNKSIAESLFLSKQTIQNYICNIYAKLETSNRLEIIKQYTNII